MPGRTRSKSKTSRKHNTSGQSSNSSYRETSQDEEESSQESFTSAAREDSYEGEDGPDFAHHVTTSSFSELEISSERGSPYSKLADQVKDLSAQYDENPALAAAAGSPDIRNRFADMTEELEGWTPEPRRSIHKATSPPTHFQERPRDSAYKSKKPYTRPKNFEYTHQYVCGICVLVLCGLLYVFSIHPLFAAAPEKQHVADDLNERELLVQQFELEFKTFMGLFPGQSRRFWKILKSSTKSVFRESEPRMPIVIIIVSNKGAHDIATCITRKFSQLVAKVYNVERPLEIHNQDILHFGDASQVKKYLDVSLQSAFEKTKVAVVHNVDKIPGEAAMIFHSYCDNQFAPYKDAAIVFTIQSDEGESLVEDSDVENYLEEKWEDQLDKDKRGALIYSRIANNVAFVHAENENVLRSVCP